jgi:hypothetical protein
LKYRKYYKYPSKYCGNLQKDHNTLLQPAEVLWLPGGRVLIVVTELREEILLAFKDIINPVFTFYLR